MNQEKPKKAGQAPAKETEPKLLKTTEECELWCKRAGITLRFTRSHVAAFPHLHPHKQVVGENVVDAVNALRRLKLKPSK